jgi:hypothetical protein
MINGLIVEHADQGVTHDSSRTDDGQVPPPPVGFHRLTDRPKTFGRTSVAARHTPRPGSAVAG